VGMRRPVTRRVVAFSLSVVVGASLAVGSGTPAQAAPATPSERKVAAKLAFRITAEALGRNTAAMVIDAPTGRVIWSRRATSGLMPASVAKLSTALTAIDVLGPKYRVKTRVTRRPGSGLVFLVGGGDPLLTSGAVVGLAERSAAGLRRANVRRVAVRVDDSLFPRPTRSAGWKKSYYPHEVAPVRALIVNQRERMDTGIDAGRTFASALRTNGIRVTSVRRKQRPAGTSTIASHTSAGLNIWLKRMLLVSDNDIAENVLRLAAVGAGKRPTWTNARAVRNAVLARHGITGLKLYDGSGLSRKDRMTAEGTARLLRVLYTNSQRNDVIAALPVAGRTGTLKAGYHRFTSKPASCARGDVQAKTGTLDDAAALAGVATTSWGRDRIFVILENGKPSNTRVKKALDGLAATVVGCY
jgi:D-alanyl-D-alanine carboxypeptidase/D-alanyl-D-alanine-endopeptidase (penicillin-binding protein 4)